MSTETLHSAARQNDASRVGELLAADPSMKDDRDDNGLTALHICATSGCYEAAVVLLQYNSNIHLRDFENGWSALHRALYFRQLKLALLLIKAGSLLGDSFTGSTAWKAEVKARSSSKATAAYDNDGYTPLDLLSATLAGGLAKAKLKMDRTSVCCFGKADFQLGIPLPNNSPDVLRARRIDALKDARVVQIGAARHHSFALTKGGAVLTWGHGKGGRLGHGDETTQPSPVQISSLHKIFVVSVSVAENHTLALTSEGHVYSWGSDRFGQLGRGGSDGPSPTPRRVLGALKRSFVLGVAAADTHSVCFDDLGEVYACTSPPPLLPPLLLPLLPPLLPLILSLSLSLSHTHPPITYTQHTTQGAATRTASLASRRARPPPPT